MDDGEVGEAWVRVEEALLVVVLLVVSTLAAEVSVTSRAVEVSDAIKDEDIEPLVLNEAPILDHDTGSNVEVVASVIVVTAMPPQLTMVSQPSTS